MWSPNFSDRLIRWNKLRSDCQTLPTEQALLEINQWWHQTPWTSYYLHWDDRSQWPDPWQLLEDNVYCSLARALGMLYTIALLERTDMDDAELTDTGNDNLVLVESGKYILNWSLDTIVNISPGPRNPHRSITKHQLQSKIN